MVSPSAWLKNNLLSNDDKYFVKVTKFRLEKLVQLSIPNSMDLNYPEANVTTVSAENVVASIEKMDVKLIIKLKI